MTPKGCSSRIAPHHALNHVEQACGQDTERTGKQKCERVGVGWRVREDQTGGGVRSESCPDGEERPPQNCLYFLMAAGPPGYPPHFPTQRQFSGDLLPRLLSLIHTKLLGLHFHDTFINKNFLYDSGSPHTGRRKFCCFTSNLWPDGVISFTEGPAALGKVGKPSIPGRVTSAHVHAGIDSTLL